METNKRFEYIVSTLVRFRTVWVLPAAAGAVLAVLFVLFLKSDTWTARQALVVRDDLLGQSFKPGQFSSQEAMKSAQETILEIARKPDVIRQALDQLGPPQPSGFFSRSTQQWPDEEVIEDVQGMVTLSAPNGAEFGKTEVIILSVKSSERERTREFIGYLMKAMDKKIDEVRRLRLESMEAELLQARDASALSLTQSTEKLRQMETELGVDVTTMTGMTSLQGGGGECQSGTYPDSPGNTGGGIRT